jgi:hypothetical protein
MPRCDRAASPAASPSAASAFRLAAIPEGRSGNPVVGGDQPRRTEGDGRSCLAGTARRAPVTETRGRMAPWQLIRRIPSAMSWMLPHAARDQAAPGKSPSIALNEARREPFRTRRSAVAWRSRSPRLRSHRPPPRADAHLGAGGALRPGGGRRDRRRPWRTPWNGWRRWGGAWQASRDVRYWPVPPVGVWSSRWARCSARSNATSRVSADGARHDGRLSSRHPAGRALQLDGGGAGLRSEVPGPVLGVVVMTTMVVAIYRIVPNRTFTRHRSCPERCSPAS